MRTDNQRSFTLLSPLLLAGVAALTSFVGALDLARALADMGPQVGDVITFQSDRGMTNDMSARLDVARITQGTCRLDAGVMHASGGSLVVERRQVSTPHRYQVHWSGLKTSTDDQNCGRSADLVLRDSDMEVLALAAGGYGVAHKQQLPMGAFGSAAEPLR
jgi:hypothetical protein